MPFRIDPEGRELRALERLTSWQGKRVLDIGCGDGRLTVRLAQLGAEVTGVDPDRSLITEARRGIPDEYSAQIRYRLGNAESLPRLPGPFDIAVFSWSL
jgi:2-polyprenyl-3-methyl-5-hydroxy-6-metoxy-1,4-benzoquinol methylase